jgi:hypothetical protein
LSDDELLANTRRLVGRSNQLLAALLLSRAGAARNESDLGADGDVVGARGPRAASG